LDTSNRVPGLAFPGVFGSFEMAPPFVITHVLEQLWKHAHELSHDPTVLLKLIGQRIAQRMHDLALSNCPRLLDELNAKCNGDRGRVLLDPLSFQLERTVSYPADGWCLDAVTHFESTLTTASAKYEYVYSCNNLYGYSRKGLFLSQRSHDYTVTRFAVNGALFFFYESLKIKAVFRDCDWSLHVSLSMRRLPMNPLFLVELVSFKSAAFTHVCYDRTNMTAIVQTTFTNSMTCHWAIKTFGDVRDTNRVRLSRAPFNPLTRTTRLQQLLDYNERTLVDAYTTDPVRHLMEIDVQIVKLAQPAPTETRANVTLFPLHSKKLTRERRGRLFRIAHKFLITKAQQFEEKRAQDPVKKCAACAVQAAKTQLVLGLEPPSKRQRA